MIGRPSRANLAEVRPLSPTLTIHLMTPEAAALAAKEGDTGLRVSLRLDLLGGLTEGLDESHELPQLSSVEEEGGHFSSRNPFSDHVAQFLVGATIAQISAG
jgi:hypothetical protein